MDTRTIDLKDLIKQFGDAFPTLSAVHLFGSRLYQTGSARSDVDILVAFNNPIPSLGEISEWASENEPYIDVFVLHSNAATSAVNGSQIVSKSGKLLDQLGASLIWEEGAWLMEKHRMHRVIDRWAPVATMATPGVGPFKPIDVPPPCDILIVSALQQEHEAVRRELPDPASWSPAGGTAPTFEVSLVRTARARDKHVAAAVSPRMGMAPAALVTKSLVDFLTPGLVILVGIAGGISRAEISLGDLVIPDAICDYEATKVTPAGEQNNGLISPVSAAAYQSIKEGDWSNWIKKTGKLRPNYSRFRRALQIVRGTPLPPMRIHFDGPMASGHKVVADSERGMALRGLHRKISSIDMESWGVSEACAFSRDPTPFIAIKSISDYADDKKDDDWHDFCCQASAAFAVELITQDVV